MHMYVIRILKLQLFQVIHILIKSVSQSIVNLFCPKGLFLVDI